MPIVTRCSEPGCTVMTIGPWCVDHDRTPVTSFERGRPLHLFQRAKRRRPASLTADLVATGLRSSVPRLRGTLGVGGHALGHAGRRAGAMTQPLATRLRGFELPRLSATVPARQASVPAVTAARPERH